VTTCSTEHLFPGSAQALGGFFSGKTALSTGEEEHIGFGQGTLAVAPRNFFDGHAAAAPAIDAPHSVEQEDEESPQRNELKAPFGKLVVARLMAAAADRGRTLARPDRDLDTLVVRTECGPMINKSPKTMAPVLES
jgi:hypothetical protein